MTSGARPRGGRLKGFLADTALMLASLAVLALLAEIGLRFAPVNDGFDFQVVDAAQPVFRATPDRDVTSSKDWDFFGARGLHVNNAGFRND